MKFGRGGGEYFYLTMTLKFFSVEYWRTIVTMCFKLQRYKKLLYQLGFLNSVLWQFFVEFCLYYYYYYVY